MFDFAKNTFLRSFKSRLQAVRRCVLPVMLAQAAGLCGCAGQNNALPADAPTVTIGIDPFEPYCYLDANGQYAGIDVDLATEAFTRLGYKVEFQEINWPDKDSLLQDGTVDCLWACFSMSGRADQYQWSGPYMYSRQVVAVRADSNVHDLADLAGKRIGVQATTKGEGLFLGKIPSDLPAAGQVSSFATTEDMFAALRKGYVDAVCGHEALVAGWIGTETIAYRLLDESPLKTELGVAFAKGTHAELSAALTQTLEQMQYDGTTGRILEKYGVDAQKAMGGDENA